MIWCEDENFFKENPHYNFNKDENLNNKDNDDENSVQSSKQKPNIRKNAQDDILSSVLANHSIHADPIIHNSWLFKNVPSYSTNNFCGCPYDRQKIVNP